MSYSERFGDDRDGIAARIQAYKALPEQARKSLEYDALLSGLEPAEIKQKWEEKRASLPENQPTIENLILWVSVMADELEQTRERLKALECLQREREASTLGTITRIQQDISLLFKRVTEPDIKTKRHWWQK